MYREKLIKSLGTTEAKQYITEILAPAILLANVPEDNCWRVVDAREVDLCQFEFEDLNQLIHEFDGEVLTQDEDFCLLTKSSDKDMKSMMKKYWHQSTALEQLNKDKSILTKFTYQLLSLEKLIPSLLEPFPVEVLLNILIDSLGEIFTACAASYAVSDNKTIKKVGSVGCYQFPDELPVFENCYVGSVVKKDHFLIACISDDDLQYYILFKRDEDFQDEEISILKMLTSLLQKSRFLLNKQGKQYEVETLLNQFEFVIEALKDFSTQILSSLEEEQLYQKSCDAIKEMFQAEYVAIFEKQTTTSDFQQKYCIDLKKRTFVGSVTVEQSVDTGKITVSVPFQYQRCYGIKTDTEREMLIFIGESVLENYYKKEIISALDNIIPAELKRVFSNLDAIEKIKEQSDYIETIARNMWYVAENLQEIEMVKNVERLLEKINVLSEYSINNRFKSIKLYEKIDSESEHSLTVGDDDAPFGSLTLEKKPASDMKDNYMLSLLSQIALQTNEKINVFRPGESFTDFESVVVDFMKVKYRLGGFSGSPAIYQLDVEQLNVEILEGYGVGMKVGSTMFFASYLSAADLNRLFEEV